MALAQAPASDRPDFEAKVRPILAANCYDCHAEKDYGGLRLDSREAMLEGGVSGPAIVPGDPDKSLLIQAVRQTNEKLKMPKGGRLKPDDIAVLTEWVKAGAVWPAPAATAASAGKPGGRPYIITPQQRAFWSYQPIQKAPVPAVSHGEWPKTDIDRFVLAGLERAGLAPVAAADKLTLIRRATLDLTGLPPTLDEIEAFQKDESPDAFAKVVDRLLARRATAKRGAGSGSTSRATAKTTTAPSIRKAAASTRTRTPICIATGSSRHSTTTCRTTSSCAASSPRICMGDEGRARRLPALGFLGLGPWFYDNGAVEITRADERHDKVDVVSRGFLGLTVGCARCHDHKYDPIPTKDYYSLSGVFLNSPYKEYPLAPKGVVDEYTEHDKKIEKKEKLLEEFTRTEGTQLSQTLALQASTYMAAAWRVSGEPKEDVAKVVDDQKLDFELFDRWLKFLAKPPRFYPYLTKWQEMVKSGGSAKEAKTLADEFQALLLDVMFERKEVNDENDIIKAKALVGTKKKEPAKLPSDFVTNDDFCPGCGLELKSMPIERQNLWTDVFLRDLAEGFDPAYQYDRIKPGVLLFRGWGLERQLSADRRRYVDGLKSDIEKLRKDQPPKYPFVHGVADAEKPVNLKVSLRGSPYNLGDEAPRHFLSILSAGDPEAFSKGSGRLELADAILRQPIAMRVIVNRIWKGHFGTGLVDTPSNFGITGERPTNPELLEYLAQSFMDDGLSIKKLHRAIMTSAVYQLSTDHNQAAFDKDSGNRLYWRANRQRMTAEQVRDSLLFVAGALDTKMGGPSAPLTPLYDRRTVYGKVSRYKLDDFLQLFDFPSPNLSAEKRFTTSVPLQRLFFMNSDFMQQQGERVAQRLAGEADNRARVQKAYRLIFGRPPTDAELTAGLAFIASAPLKDYEERKAAAAKKTTDDKAGAKDPSTTAGSLDGPGAGRGR